MKKLYGSSKTTFFILFILTVSTTYAQNSTTYRKKVVTELSKLDLAGIKNGVFLNLSIFSSAELDNFRNLKPNQKQTSSNAENWENLYERLSRAQLVEKRKTFPEFTLLTGTSIQNKTKNNIIPIGILDVEGTLLTEQQLKEAEKKNSIKNNSPQEYERIRFLSASVLQEEVYQAEVQFKISPDLLITNRASSIQSAEIDFNDGKGFTNYKIVNQLIDHTFNSLGKNSIKIKLQTPEGPYLFESVVNVTQFERKTPFREFQMTASPIAFDTVTYRNGSNNRISVVPGANVRILLGCDGVFNKPLLLVEGTDLGEDVNLDKLEAFWTGGQQRVLEDYTAEGYDPVFLDWQNSHDFIQNNAQVLKAVINEINQTKVGSNQLVAIATSMGGLVSRWALREMENASQQHHVSHLICHDTPHQGANIPIGLTQLYWETPLDVMENLLVFALNKYWSNYYHALQAPSSRQMLMHWGGEGNVGVGNKHPDFDNFRTALTSLGNGGYPATCKNIAMINGSMDASDRSLFDDFNYGDRIVLGWVPGFKRNTAFDIHTNDLSQSKQVLRIAVLQIPPKFPTFLLKTINYNNSVNDDFLPGGTSSVDDRVIEFISKNKFRFAFVPTFSSIDFQGSRATQIEREMLSSVAVDAVTGPGRQSPFAAIYGRIINTSHGLQFTLPWFGLGISEGLITFTGCAAAPTPPAPNVYFSGGNPCFPFEAHRENHSFDLTVNIQPTGIQYRQILKLEKLGTDEIQEGYVVAGQDSYTFQVYSAGQYRVTCTRSYPGRPDLIATAQATANVSNCIVLPVIGDTDALLPNLDCKGFWENDYLVTLQNDVTQHVFAHLTPSLDLYASIGEDDPTGIFVDPATLEANGFFAEFAACFSAIDPRIALPVVLQNFNARAEGQTALLTWRTASEINSERFEIERSQTGRDWQQIGSVHTKSVGIESTDYSFTDEDPSFNIVYYRLKMIDADESFAYSKIQSVQLDGEGIVVYPNPVEGGKQLRLLLNDSKVEKIYMYDLGGKVVYEANGPIEQINTKNLMNGRYVLKIQFKDGTESSQVIIKR
ncbi:MAG: T9SS type A sorting domain-containing protein [Dyadobacter sp.]|uniref:T9SS type A sorting domain-containing protein n=1 Tax=Dyadobacter sp. TaxID=1914288 RepID=UPI00326573E2